MEEMNDASAKGPTPPEIGYFDKHSGILGIIVTVLLLLYTAGLLLVWYGLALEDYTTATNASYLVIYPTFFVMLLSYASRSREVAFSRIHIKSHSIWLLLNEVLKFVTSIDLMLAAVGAATPGLLLFSPAIKPGFFTVDRITLLWAVMAVLALFSLLYGRSLMQLLGMKYETFGGASLIGAAAFSSIAALEFRNERRRGLDYLAASLDHVKSVLWARRSELEAIDKARLVVRSMKDATVLPFKDLGSFANHLTTLPRLTELPANLGHFLSDTKWPHDIKPIRRRSYGIEWVAATATITAALVGFIASIIETSEKSPVVEALLSPPAAYVAVASTLFVVAIVLYRRLAQYSVETRDIDEFERDLVLRSNASIGTRTTLSTMALIPKAFIATGSAVLTFISAFFLVDSLIIAIWYRNFLSFFPSSVFVFAGVLFVMSFLITYALIRNIKHELKPKDRD